MVREGCLGGTNESLSGIEIAALQQLIDVVAQLRDPNGGCPWDLAQTPQTLTPYVIEEAYEVVDAIRSGDPGAIREELGDLLLQVVLQAQIAAESGEFSLTEVAQGIILMFLAMSKSKALMKCVKTGSKSKQQKKANPPLTPNI